jgi:hypothetical protein
MANEFVIKNGFFSQGTSNVTGNLIISQTISGTTGQFSNLTSSIITGTTGLFVDLTASVISASNIYGNTANFNQITASFVNFLNVTGTYSGNGSSLTNITASTLSDNTGTFAVQNIQDGQYLKRVGNTIVGTFIATFMINYNEVEVVYTLGNSGDSLTIIETSDGSAV